MNCGIYKITTSSGNFYIGSSKNLKKRERDHRRDLRRGAHHSTALQRAWERYGAIDFSIILICEEHNLFFYEQLLIDRLKPPYNMSPGASGTRGLKWSDESREKIKGRRIDPILISEGMLRGSTQEERRLRAQLARAAWTDVSREIQIQKLTGNRHSEKVKKKRAASLRGRPVSEETRAKISAQRGWKHSDETLAKLQGRSISDAHRAKISEANRGNKNRLGAVLSEETKKAISEKLKGRPRSSEAVEKQRATIAARKSGQTNHTVK